MASVLDIYSEISANLFKSNIEDAQQRLDCAKRIYALMGGDPNLEPPRGGVVLYYREGDGCLTMVAKSDPVALPGKTVQRIIDSLQAMQRRKD